MDEAPSNEQLKSELGEDQFTSGEENPGNRRNPWFSGEVSSSALARWRLGLFLVGSAALGGIAVAVWNRHLLSQMRRPPEQYSLFPDDDDDGFVV